MNNVKAMIPWMLFSLLVITGPAVAGGISNSELDQRVSALEAKESGQEWAERIALSGAVEVELGHTNTDYQDAATDDVSENAVALATVELGVDAEIHEHVSGHVLFLYEEGEDILVDEGFITVDGKDALPLYLNAGRIYLPFGQFESHMVSGPVTTDLGETGQSAIQVGFANDMIDASLAFFNGDVDETDADDDIIDSYALGVQFTMPEDTIALLGLTAGVSYISNLADTDGFEGFLTTEGEVADAVAGMGAFISVSFMDKAFLEAEYIAAMDEFTAADLSFADGDELAPSAWNLELAYALLEGLELAVRYAQTSDIKGGVDDEVLPESQYGLAAAYEVFDSTTIALEYLASTYENDDEVSAITAQLAIEF
jgi:hypothetical protein